VAPLDASPYEGRRRQEEGWASWAARVWLGPFFFSPFFYSDIFSSNFLQHSFWEKQERGLEEICKQVQTTFEIMSYSLKAIPKVCKQ
jgi:hypothetical protein